MSPPSSRPRLALAIVALALAAHATLAWLAREPGILTGQDDAIYLLLARSLRHGGYHDLFRVDAPVHALYPPVYPALLAGWGAVMGERYDALVALTVLLSAGCLLLLYLTLRRVVEPGIALAAILVLAVNPDLVRFGGAIASETAFALFSVLCLFLLSRMEGGARGLGLAGAAAILAALTRSIGVTLLAALAVHWALQRRWSAVGWLSLAGAATVGAWLFWTLIAPDQHVGVSYAADLKAGITPVPWVEPFPRRLLVNLAFYGRRLPETLGIPSLPGTLVDNVAAVALLGASLLAGLGAMLRQWRPAALYGLVYGGLLLVWTWSVERFLVPMTLLVVPLILLGAGALARRLRPSLAGIAPWWFAMALGAGGAAGSLARVRSQSACDRSGELPPPACLTADQASYFDAVRYIRSRAPQDSIWYGAKTATLYFYTGRRSISYRGGLAQDTASFLPYLRSRGVSYIFLASLEKSEYERLAPRLRANCRSLALERSFLPRTFLFRIPDRATPEQSEEACRAVAQYLAANAGHDFNHGPVIRGAGARSAP